MFVELALLDKNSLKSLENDVLDEKTAKSLEVDKLAELVAQFCITNTGKVFTRTEVYNPSTSVKQIKAKQDALRELQANDTLKQSIVDFLARVKELEPYASMLFRGRYYPNFLAPSYRSPFKDLREARQLLTSIPKWARDIGKPDAELLRSLKAELENFQNAGIYYLAKGPIFRQWGRGVVSGREIKWDRPPLPYNPTYIKAIYLMGFIFPPLGLFVAHGARIEADLEHFILPASRRFQRDTNALTAYNTIGTLDELVAHDSFRKSLGQYASLSDIIEGVQHEFYAEDIVNPVQYLHRPEGFVSNTLHIGGGRQLIFLTGPNSGGKTSISIAAQHAQILFQTGGYVPAKKARMTVADRIYNQVVEPNDLLDEEGGLGSQLRRSKELLFSSSPYSFIVIDDLNEATTFEEKMEITGDILHGYLLVGATAMYVSHLYQLAQQFQGRGIGVFLQVEFNGIQPTYRIVPGISTVSHAELVAQRIGIDQGSIVTNLRQKGYLSDGADFRDVSRFLKAYK